MSGKVTVWTWKLEHVS